LFSGSIVRLPAQETNSSTIQGSVSVAKLFPPVYPPLAKQTRVTGDVELTLVVQADGSFKSATVANGQPLLKQAALESAQHSQFACENCDKEPRSFQMVY
jgi:TonB family protein